MDKINKTIDQCQRLIKSGQQQGSTNTDNTKTPKQNLVMDRLWLRMTEIYGHRWISSYGSKPNGSWTAALSEVPAEELKTGLDAMLKNCLEWPPTLTEFISFCKPPRVNPMHREFQLPKPINKDKENGHKQAASLLDLMKESK